MIHRPSPVALRLAAALFALAILFAAAPARAIVIDEFLDGTTPTFDGTRSLVGGNIDVIPFDDGFLTYDGSGEAGVIFTPTSPLDLTNLNAIEIGFIQIAGPADEPLDADIRIVLDDGANTAVLGPTALPYVSGQPYEDFGTVTRVRYKFADFIGIGSLDIAAVTGIEVYFDGQDQIVIAADFIQLVPAPAALPAGLIILAALTLRRRR